MLVYDLLRKYNFHDSNMIEIIHKNNKLILRIDFCRWKQKDYENGEDELKEISLEFDNVKDFVWNPEKIVDYDTILDFTYVGEKVKIVLFDNEVLIITFACKTVYYYE